MLPLLTAYVLSADIANGTNTRCECDRKLNRTAIPAQIRNCGSSINGANHVHATQLSLEVIYVICSKYDLPPTRTAEVHSSQKQVERQCAATTHIADAYIS